VPERSRDWATLQQALWSAAVQRSCRK